MFGLFGGAAAVTTTEVKPQGRFPQKDRFRHKTTRGLYDFVWSGWKPIYNQPICCAQWFAMPVVDPRGAPWSRRPGIPLWQPYGFYSSTTGTAGTMLSPSYVVDTTLIEGHPIITPFSTPKQKAHSRFESYDRLMKMIKAWNEEPPRKYYVRGDVDVTTSMEPGDLIPVEEIAKFKMK